VLVDSYEINEEDIFTWVKSNGARKVLIQAPDGLKKIALAVSELLEERDVRAFISAGHAWGGCDVAYDEARSIGVDAIIHIGHHGPVWFKPPGKPRVLFVPAFSTLNPTRLVAQAAREAKDAGASTLAIVTTIQHAKWLPALKEAVASEGLKPVTGSLSGVEGLIVGCNYASIRRADAVVVVAGGLFHALGAAVWSERPTWSADPYQEKVSRVELRNVVARRLYAISKAIDARSFLIVVSSKPGQNRVSLATRVKRTLEERGRKALIAVFNEVTRELLENIQGFEAFVNTACPRLALDDEGVFPGPVLNPGELKYVLSGSVEGYSLRDALVFDLRLLDGP